MKTSRLVPAAICACLMAGCATNPLAKACSEPNIALGVVGGLAGGLVGSQIGAGLGRDLAIAAGAGTGAVLGSRTNCR